MLGPSSWNTSEAELLWKTTQNEESKGNKDHLSVRLWNVDHCLRDTSCVAFAESKEGKVYPILCNLVSRKTNPHQEYKKSRYLPIGVESTTAVANKSQN
jgi:hypothetical protein